MFSVQFDQVVHFHLAKCGGTSLNAYLDMSVPFARARPAHEGPRFESEWSRHHGSHSERGRLSEGMWAHDMQRRANAWWDVVHDHNPRILPGRDAAYRLTILRNPVDRVLSQLRDYRRLADQDITRMPKGELAFVAAARSRPTLDVIEEFHEHPSANLVLSNYMTRALSCAYDVMFPQHSDLGMREKAERVLVECFQLVGITERMQETVTVLARDLGLPVPESIPNHNVTRSDGDAPENEALRRRIEEINADDLHIYGFAQRLLENRLAAPPATEPFELAPLRLRQMAPVIQNDSARFDFNMMVMGSGFFSRDAGGTAECAVWMGPQAKCTLYMPVPKDELLVGFVDLAGYRHEAQRAGLRIYVDGTEMPHRFVDKPGFADSVEFAFRAPRGFMRLNLSVPTTMTDAEAGVESEDDRRKGVCLRGYGYRFASHAERQFALVFSGKS